MHYERPPRQAVAVRSSNKAERHPSPATAPPAIVTKLLYPKPGPRTELMPCELRSGNAAVAAAAARDQHISFFVKVIPKVLF